MLMGIGMGIEDFHSAYKNSNSVNLFLHFHHKFMTNRSFADVAGWRQISLAERLGTLFRNRKKRFWINQLYLQQAFPCVLD